MNDIIDYQEDTSHLLIRFYETTKRNEAKSTAEGRPVHDTVDMVEIRIAGDKNTIIHAPAHDPSKPVQGYGHLTYAQRFPRHWEHYSKTKLNLDGGTPLEELTAIDAARRADLKALSIHTVEALSTLADSALKKVGMDAQKLRDLARNYLAAAEGNAPIVRLTEENENMKTQLSALEAELNRLKSQSEPKRETLSVPAKDKAA